METEDWRLIEAWKGGSQEAFTELVRRHLPLVLAAARRQMRDPALAEDAAQTVFLLLARKAPILSRNTVLPGWLFNTTRLVVRHLIRSETRRRQRELLSAAMEPSQPSSSDPVWDRAGVVLDDALARLSAADRDALLLRFTEGRNHREVGLALGIGEEAARKRVDRAVERLRVQLAGAGVTFATVTLVAFLQERMEAAPLGGVVERISSAAVGNPLASPVVQALVAAERTSRWVQWGAAAGLAVCLSIGAALLTARKPSESFDRKGEPSRPGTEPGSVGDPTRNAGIGAGLPFQTNPVPFLLRVVTGGESRPVAGARVFANYVVGSTWIPLHGLQTGADGLCAVPIPAADLGRLDVAADSPGLGTRAFKWMANWGTPRPANHTLRLQPAATIGGVVLGTNGAPLPETTVTIAYNNGDAAWDDPELVKELPGFVGSVSAGVTDAHGRWRFDSVPPDIGRFQIELRHPDHAPMEIPVQPAVPSERELWRLLGRHQLTNQLHAGHFLSGVVVDPAGRPLPGVHVSNEDYRTNGVTGMDGSFLLRPVRPEQFRVSLWARGYAAKSVRMMPDQPPQRIVLERGGRIRARVVNTEGAPIPGAYVGLLEAGLDPGVTWGWSSDRDGRIEWDSAPPEGQFRFHVSAPGYQALQEVRWPVSEAESQVTLTALPMGEFLVTDAVTGLRVPAFKVIPGARLALDSELENMPYRFDVGASRVGQDGQLRMELLQSVASLFQVEAEGYLPLIVDAGPPGPDGLVQMECRMKPMAEADRVRGRVVDASGRPVQGAEVAMTTLSNYVEVRHARLFSDQSRYIQRTDAEGRFELKPQMGGVWVVAVHAAGFGRVPASAGVNGDLVLQPLGGISGRWLDEGGRPLAGRQVALSGAIPYPGNCALGQTAFTVATDADGRFRFEGVPPGRWLVRGYPLAPGSQGAVSDYLPVVSCVELEPGMTLEGIELAHLQPGSVTVRGRFESPAEAPVGDWKLALNTASLRPIVPRRSPPAGLPADQQRSWWAGWAESEEGFAAGCRDREYPLRVSSDGTFEASGLPPGEYRLRCIVIAGGGALKSLGELDQRPWSASIETPVVVPGQESGTEQPLWLGEFRLARQRAP